MFNLHVFLCILHYKPSLGIKVHLSGSRWPVTLLMYDSIIVSVCVSHQCLNYEQAAFESLFRLSKSWTVGHPGLETYRG